MKTIILAAGKGKRLHSEEFNLPKVLRNALGKPLISYVLESLNFIPQEDTTIVVGYKKDMVKKYVTGDYNYASQDEQLGTGHAVMMAKDLFKDYKGDVLITYGDMPLLSKETFKQLIESHKKSGCKCTLVTSITDAPLAYGRIIRDKNGELCDIIETKDCTKEQLLIKEMNVGVYIFDNELLFNNLNKLNNNNNQKEYYLTDMPKLLLKQGFRVNTFTLSNSDEMYGVNTLEELDFCQNILKRRMII